MALVALYHITQLTLFISPKAEHEIYINQSQKYLI